MLRSTTFVLAMGIGLILFGGAELLPPLLHSPHAFVTIVVGTSVAGGAGLYRMLRELSKQRRLEQSRLGASPFAEEWIPMLYGDFTPYIVEAAERLGESCEATAVPALMYVLEQTVNTQPPGWRDTAEAMTIALGKMGDRRALPLLYRLTNWRGIGLLTAVHEAIDRIEPQTSLLRPGSAADLPTETLLRPADFGAESDPALLLRASHNL